MTPRLFSCAILQLKSSGYAIEQMQPLLSLLRGYVDAELASLEDLNITNEVRRKKTHFCSFDLSSTITPVDTFVESNDIIERCIGALHRVVQRVDGFSSSMDLDNVVESIDSFITILLEIENETDQESFAECSKVRSGYESDDRLHAMNFS